MGEGLLCYGQLTCITFGNSIDTVKELPILPVELEAHLSFTTHADGNELELMGNRAGLLLLAKAALGMAETLRGDGFHIHLDDLYSINSEGKSILIRKEERPKP